MKLSKYFGPSTLIAAAFIGPGTITTCTMAGVTSGYSLIWAMVFSTIATIIFQEMSARLGFITEKGLGEAISNNFQKGFFRYLIFSLVIGAILIGNAAYEAGNLSGGVLGFQLTIGDFQWWPLVLGFVGFMLLYFGKYKWIENVLIGLVIAMSLCFFITAILVKPDLIQLMQGFIPQNIKVNYLLIMALIGTTVVPYNLFLHASIISKKHKGDSTLRDVRIENNVSIILGGLISIFIIIAAAGTSTHIGEVNSAKDLAIQLEPLFGSHAKILMGIGLIAAGFSSALTAPLAAALAAKGLFGWTGGETSAKFRSIWILVLIAGISVNMTGVKPVLIIKFAQIMNAILLPFIAIFLIYLCNKKGVLKEHTNNITQNIAAGFVLLISILLSIKSILHFIQNL